MARTRKPVAREPQKADTPDTVGKRVTFDLETWQALDLLARGRMMPFQELADEAVRDVLRKYGRPYDTRDAFKRSARLAQANDNPGNGRGAQRKRPTGGRRARS